MELTLKLVNGEVIQQRIEADSFIIGRSSKADIVVPHEGMSRQHCQIDVINGEIFVTDLGSTNGVLIDGHKIEPHKKIPYQTYLSLSFGAVQSLQIDTEERLNSLTSSLPKGGAQNNTRTITKSMQEAMKPQATPEAAKSNVVKNSGASREEKIKSILINILAIAILGGAVYWYMQKEETPSEDATYEGATQEGPSEEYDRF